MDWIRTLLSRCAALVGGRKHDTDLDEELRAHIDLAIAENLRNGMNAEQARTEALRAFGGMTQIKEQYRTGRGFGWLETFWQDIHFALRTLWKSPGFTAVVAVTLALGIGGNTAMFSIVNGVLLNPLPFSHAEQLVSLHESKPNFQEGSISYPNFLDWRGSNKTFSSMSLTRSWSFSMTGRGDAEQLQGQYLSAGFFSVLGVRPLLGREFSSIEEQRNAQPVALISEGLWRRKFDASPVVLGQKITLDGKNFTVIGIIPANFRLQFSNFRQKDVYVPIMQWDNPLLLNRGGGLGFHGIGRLKPGVTLAQAQADMNQVMGNLAAAYPDVNHGVGATLKPLKEQMVGEVRPFLLVLLAAVAFVLLIACVNVASLLLARAESRSREFAVRAALGASRARVVRQLLTESLLLGLASGAIGLVAAYFGTHFALKLLPAALPRAEEIGVDTRVLAFTFALSLITGILFGVVPALKTSRANPQAALKKGGRGAVGSNHRVLGGLVVAEMAIALVLLTGAGLMIHSLVRLWSVDPGFNPHGVWDFGLSLPPTVNNASPDGIRSMIRQLDANFASVPGVKAVSQTWGAVPMGGEDDIVFWREGQPKPKDDQHMSWTLDYLVEPDYLRVMQIPLLRGRFFSQSDDEHSPLVAVVDDVFARKFFPNEDPIGKMINVNNPTRKLQIVGIVGHVRQWGLDADDTQPLRAQLYIPCMQMPDEYLMSSPTGTHIILRYDGDSAQVFEAIRRANKRMSNEQVIFGEQTMESVVADSMASRRFAMILLVAFALLAMALACVGIYGVMAYLVSQRTQELGIRMALGAQRSNVLGLVFTRGAKLTLTGIAIGLVAGLALARLMDSLLYGVSSTDPLTLSAVALLLMLVAMAACYLPAMRAASIDPMRALRTE